MGTRHLTAVYYNGEYKVAQYGQWDGYPSGAGLTCLEFLANWDEKKFKNGLDKCHYISADEYDAFLVSVMNNVKEIERYKESGTIPMGDYCKFSDMFPSLSRDTGSRILYHIEEVVDKLPLRKELDFAKDSLFCEWAWVIDLDKRTFEAYEGFNNNPLTDTDRFYWLQDTPYTSVSGEDYYPVKLVQSWSIDNLPTKEEFLEVFSVEKEDE